MDKISSQEPLQPPSPVQPPISPQGKSASFSIEQPPLAVSEQLRHAMKGYLEKGAPGNATWRDKEPGHLYQASATPDPKKSNASHVTISHYKETAGKEPALVERHTYQVERHKEGYFDRLQAHELGEKKTIPQMSTLAPARFPKDPTDLGKAKEWKEWLKQYIIGMALKIMSDSRKHAKFKKEDQV